MVARARLFLICFPFWLVRKSKLREMPAGLDELRWFWRKSSLQPLLLLLTGLIRFQCSILKVPSRTRKAEIYDLEAASLYVITRACFRLSICFCLSPCSQAGKARLDAEEREEPIWMILRGEPLLLRATVEATTARREYSAGKKNRVMNKYFLVVNRGSSRNWSERGQSSYILSYSAGWVSSFSSNMGLLLCWKSFDRNGRLLPMENRSRPRTLDTRRLLLPSAYAEVFVL
jgi:hypothetical protein